MPRASLGAMVAVYALVIGLVALVAGYGAHHVAGAPVGELAPGAKAPVVRIAEPKVVREGAMTLTQDRWSRPYSRSDYSTGSQFGSSSRGSSRPRGFFEDLFEWDGRERPETYRTVCVRLCDGYYFPISFSAAPERFERDQQVCENSCGTQARLYIYRNPGGELEDMQDLQGRPYRQLHTAFLYRTQYVADCKCRPHPWEEQAQDQHRAYALAAAKRKGDKAAAAELATLEAKMRLASTRSAKTPPKTARVAGPVVDDGLAPGAPTRSAQRSPQDASEAELMRLGRKSSRMPQQYGRNGWPPRSPWKDF